MVRIKTDSKLTRLPEIMSHTTRYSSKGRTRLAADSRCAPSTLSRLFRRGSSPTWELLNRVTKSLERATGRQLDPREIFSVDGTYPTKNVCELLGCPGCYPPWAHDAEGVLLPEFSRVKAGTWSLDPALSGVNRAAGRRSLC